MVICAGGGTSGILAKALNKMAKERNLPLHAAARAYGQHMDIIHDIDLIILAPQMDSMKDNLKEIADHDGSKLVTTTGPVSYTHLYNDTLHYAPIQITKKGYKVIVAVIHGTNAVLPEGVKSLNPRVVKCGKFQVVHPSRKDKIEQGYQVGLSGDVIKTTPLDE